MPARRSVARAAGWTALAILLFVIGLLTFAPTRVEPVEWPSPPPCPLEGPWAPNTSLSGGTTIATGVGPEDVAVGPDGRWFTGTADGRILAIASDGAITTFTETGGRPLGLAFAADGSLWVADARAGLLHFDRDGVSLAIIDSANDGSAIALADELAIAKDGTVWFTDASTRWDVDDVELDALEGQATGRVLRHDPETDTTEVVFRDLRFANGLVLADDELSLLVSETFAYRITRLWIAGPRKGTREVFAEGLPGFVDNLSVDADGTLWIGVPSLRSGLLDGLLPHPWVRRILSRVPRALLPKPAPYGLVIALDDSGKPRFNLHDPSGEVFAVTGAVPIGDELVLCSLHATSLVRIARPSLQ